MGMEMENYGGQIHEEEEAVEVSDSELVSYFREALASVSLGHREKYDQLIGVLFHNKGLTSDDVAILVTSLKGLSGAVSYIDVAHHEALLSSIFDMSLWNYGTDVMDALVELIKSLAASSGILLDSCLTMLVSNFMPPPMFFPKLQLPLGVSRREQVLPRVHSALEDITELVPLAPTRLLPIIIQRVPLTFKPEPLIVLYVENMLMLESGGIGEFVRSKMLMALVDLLIDLDVEIGWDDMLQDYSCRGIFELELEDMDDTTNDAEGELDEFLKESLTRKSLGGNAIAEKLDSLMELTFQHLNSCYKDQRLDKVFEILLQSFRLTVLSAYKSKFAQFVIFYSCSLDPQHCGVKFAEMLVNIFTSCSELPQTRMSAVAYLASYLSRAKFLSSEVVIAMLERLVYWCVNYTESCWIQDADINPKAHQVFYSGCQAIMYLLCFRLRSCIHILKEELLDLIELVLNHPLSPLKVCLPSIVKEFLRQAKTASLFTKSKKFVFVDMLETDLSKVFGGTERLDMFFPFDPYLLRKSDRFIRPNFIYWSLVTTMYVDDEDISDEDISDEDVSDYEDDNVDDVMVRSFNEDEEDIDNCGISMNKMSITPKPHSFMFANNFKTSQQRMPSRIRPSMSPESL